MLQQIRFMHMVSVYTKISLLQNSRKCKKSKGEQSRKVFTNIKLSAIYGGGGIFSSIKTFIFISVKSSIFYLYTEYQHSQNLSQVRNEHIKITVAIKTTIVLL